MFQLTVISPEGQELVQAFDRDRIVVGRHEDSDLRLVSSMISRNHCVIFKEGRRFLVKDLRSQNGTWVNGRRIRSRKHLKIGDAIQVGPFRLLFRPDATYVPSKPRRPKQEVVPEESVLSKEETEPVMKPVGMISTYLSEATASDLPPETTKVRRERLNRNLLTLYSITEDLVVTKDLDEILDHIMDRIFEIFSPSQATILLMEEGDSLAPKKHRHSEEKGSIRAISNTILDRVLTYRVGVLTDDAQEDPRFEHGDSVVVHKIRSVMAAPIWEERTILGVLYVDSLDLVAGYQREDLDLLTAIGHQTALAIQRWKLTEELRQEAIKAAVIRESLGRFHSSPVVDLILEGAADLEAKEALATIFFCDMVDFTSLCESCTPFQLQKLLNLFCRTVSEIVFEEQGTLDKFIGDAAMAIYGAPLEQTDAPVRAVRTALKIRERLEASMRSLPEYLRFRVRYGINTGLAIVGNFGSDRRIDYTVLGQPVNLAARISKAAEPNSILIGPETFEAIEPQALFKVRRIEGKRFKGLKGPIKLYEVEGFL